MTEQQTSAATPAPPTIRYAIVAALVWAVLNLLTGLSLWLDKSAVATSLTKANAKLAADKRRNYPAQLNTDVHTALTSASIGAVFIFLLVLFTAYGIKHARGWSRWVILALNVLSVIGLPVVSSAVGVVGILTVASGGDLPVFYRILSGLAGVTALALLVLLFVNPSRTWFIGNRPGRIAPAGAAPTGGLLGMFAPKPRVRAESPEPTRVVDVPVAPEAVLDEQPGQPRRARGKAKTRTTESGAPAARPVDRRRPVSKSRKV